MKIVISIILMLASSSVFAQYLACGNGASHVSFGLGVDAQVSGAHFNYTWIDTECFELGKTKAARTFSASENASRCSIDYKKGYLSGKVANSAIDSACFNLGYSAGLSALAAGAIENDSGLSSRNCILAYNAGIRDAHAGSVSNAPTDEPRHYCYTYGYYNGISF